MPWQAKHKYARISARKCRLVVDMIRNQDVQDALNMLKFSPHLGAALVTKVLTSAVASASEAEANVERLFVKEARVDDGPVMKRIREKDRGRAHPILKRTSHIVVVVDQEQEAKA